jgi:hypothetical protein
MLMAEFYQQHKDNLPSSVRERRDAIIELLMEGFSQEEAFAQAINAT